MKIAVAGGTGTSGRYVVKAGEAEGHEMVVLSRSAGIDLRSSSTDAALLEALSGVAAIVDATAPRTISEKPATEFFTDVAARLQRIGAEAGVQHIVTLSIVGVDRVPGFGYYAAKRRHEDVATSGAVPATILRATQFHEFPAQILSSTLHGPVGAVMAMRTQPIAASVVGEQLIHTAAAGFADVRIKQIAGPEPTTLVAMARQQLRASGRRALVIALPLPGAGGRAMRNGAVLPTDDVPRLGPTFTDWLATETQ